MSAWYALGRRTNREYLCERFKRLVVPLIFGTFVIVPSQVYLERFSQGQFNGSFFRFLPHYCDGFYGFGGNFPWMGLHLWYLEMLFLFSLITLPLFRFLRTGSGQGFVSQVAGLCAKPGGILLFVIPIALMEMLVNLQPKGIGFRDFGGCSPLTYLVFFLLGAVMSADPRFRKGVERGMIPALALLIVTTLAGYLLLTSGASSRAPAFALLRAGNSWCWLVAILGGGERVLNFSNGCLRYANEAVLPFYILHQTVIVVIAFFLISWNAGVAVKYAVLAPVSFVIIMVLYEVMIRRSGTLRCLFGMQGLSHA